MSRHLYSLARLVPLGGCELRGSTVTIDCLLRVTRERLHVSCVAHMDTIIPAIVLNMLMPHKQFVI